MRKNYESGKRIKSGTTGGSASCAGASSYFSGSGIRQDPGADLPDRPSSGAGGGSVTDPGSYLYQ